MKWLFLLPLPDVISWQDFRISKGPPAWLQSAFLLILFFWRTVSQNRTEKYNSYCSHYRGWTDTQQVILITLCWNKFNKWQVCLSDFIFHVFLLSLTPSPPIGSPSPHLCCMAGHGVRWSKLFPGGGTGRPCSVSKRLPVVEDTGRLCSIPGPHASVALQWCSGTSLEGTAAPGWYTGQVKSNRNIHR